MGSEAKPVVAYQRTLFEPEHEMFRESFRTFLARHLARPHAWPAGDLGLVKAVSAFYFDGRKLTIAEVREFAGRLHPFENLSAHYLLAGHRIAPPA
jgi:hypothetical protein